MKLTYFTLLSLLAIPLPGSAEIMPVGETYRLNTRSVFAAAEDARSPFWPIGWSPSKGAAPSLLVVPRVDLDLTKFVLTSTMLGSPAIAVINGRAYTEGETLKGARAALKMTVAPPPGTPYPKIRVQRIVDGSVMLECQGKLISLAMNRPTFGPRKVEAVVAEEEE